MGILRPFAANGGRFDLHSSRGKSEDNEHESRVPLGHERRIGVRGRHRFSHRTPTVKEAGFDAVAGGTNALIRIPGSLCCCATRARAAGGKPHRNRPDEVREHLSGAAVMWWLCTTRACQHRSTGMPVVMRPSGSGARVDHG